MCMRFCQFSVKLIFLVEQYATGITSELQQIKDDFVHMMLIELLFYRNESVMIALKFL